MQPKTPSSNSLNSIQFLFNIRDFLQHKGVHTRHSIALFRLE